MAKINYKGFEIEATLDEIKELIGDEQPKTYPKIVEAVVEKRHYKKRRKKSKLTPGKRGWGYNRRHAQRDKMKETLMLAKMIKAKEHIHWFQAMSKAHAKIRNEKLKNQQTLDKA